ncbi:MAG: hypothetical protein HY270_12065, partial [Deltaproteobacteria bacterium]|nr:hypothetical protein [Deltaproteobacteria bacterium]
PFIPTDDSQILERLPVSPLDPELRDLQEMRQELSRRPDNLALASKAAWKYIEQGRRQSDPRFYGYAQAALEPWWAQAAAPVPVLLLRATIRQHNHDFESALADLSALLQVDPTNAQAYLTRALIQQVRGNYEGAREDCSQVLQLATPLIAATCLTGVGSLTGEAQESEQTLRGALARAPLGDKSARLWALTVLGEIAVRRGDAAAAESDFRQALALGLRDDYLLGAYADFLLDTGRPEEVVDLLARSTRSDALLLRLALAEQAAGTAALSAHVEALQARFMASRLRGEAVHRREEARFTLHLLKDANSALRLARENWQVQHEPSDARILLESALAAGDPESARPVLQFLHQTRLEDVQLAHLENRLTGGAKR